MKKGAWFKAVRVAVVLVVAVALATLLLVFRPRAQRQMQPVRGRLVTVFQARAETVSMAVEAFGTVAPTETLRLVSQVAGHIETMAPVFVEGGFAATGTVLLTVDPRPYALEVERRRVQIDQVRAELDQLDQEETNLKAVLEIARRDTDLAKADFQRLKTLVQRKSLAQTAVDQADQRYLASRQALQTLENRLAVMAPSRRRVKAQLEMAKVGLAQAGLDLEHTRITAPFGAWVLEKRVEKGQHVVPGQFLGSIYRAGALEVEVRIPGNDLRWVSADASTGAPVRAEVTFEAGGRVRTWTGRLARTRASFDPGTRTLPAVVAIDPPHDGPEEKGAFVLRPGMFVRVRLLGSAVNDIFVLPRHALRSDDTVYIAQDGRLRIRQVGVLRRYKDQVFVNGGLADGDRIIHTPLSGAVDGMKIRTENTGTGERPKVEGQRPKP